MNMNVTVITFRPSLTPGIEGEEGPLRYPVSGDYFKNIIFLIVRRPSPEFGEVPDPGPVEDSCAVIRHRYTPLANPDASNVTW